MYNNTVDITPHQSHSITGLVCVEPVHAKPMIQSFSKNVSDSNHNYNSDRQCITNCGKGAIMAEQTTRLHVTTYPRHKH